MPVHLLLSCPGISTTNYDERRKFQAFLGVWSVSTSVFCFLRTGVISRRHFRRFSRIKLFFRATVTFFQFIKCHLPNTQYKHACWLKETLALTSAALYIRWLQVYSCLALASNSETWYWSAKHHKNIQQQQKNQMTSIAWQNNISQDESLTKMDAIF